MQDIEPHFSWRDYYTASEDPRSPFFSQEYSEIDFPHKFYNFLLHPQWDEFGASTLYLKVLYADYDQGYALIELIGEWNDTLHNDIMLLKRNVLEPMMDEGIKKFVFFAENLLNFHGGDDDYYFEWSEEMQEEGGWAVMLNTRKHVEEEMFDARLDHYLHMGEQYNDIIWRPHKPDVVFQLVQALVDGRIKRLAE